MTAGRERPSRIGGHGSPRMALPGKETRRLSRSGDSPTLPRSRFPPRERGPPLMPDLIPPHGGLTVPVSRMVSSSEEAQLVADAAKMTQVPVSDADLSSVYRFGDGGLSPLTGPMDGATWHRVLDSSYIEHGGRRFAWTIPLSLPVTEALARELRAGDRVALESSAGDVVAALDVTDVFPWDKTKYIRSVYQTERTDRPGADMVLKGDADTTHLLGGQI